MPALLGKFEKQLSTLETNMSRLVTKQRYVVEIDNGLLKRSFGALKVVQNQCLEHTIEDYRIAGALINKFSKRLYADSDSEEMAKNMFALVHKQNELKKLVNKFKLNRTNKYTYIKVHLCIYRIDMTFQKSILKGKVKLSIKHITYQNFKSIL